MGSEGDRGDMEKWMLEEGMSLRPHWIDCVVQGYMVMDEMAHRGIPCGDLDEML